MQSLIIADEIFAAIQNYESDGITPQKALLNMAFVMEQQAREMLIKEGYGVWPEYLTGDIDHDREEWNSEALQLLSYRLPYPLHECAMVILETDKVRELIMASTHGADLAISMSKLISMSLLPAELENYSLIQNYIEPDKKRQKGRRKGGKATALERKKEADLEARAVQKAWNGLSQPDREKAGILAKRFNCTAQTIRNRMKRKLSSDE